MNDWSSPYTPPWCVGEAVRFRRKITTAVHICTKNTQDKGMAKDISTTM